MAKKTTRRQAGSRQRGGTIAGILIGLILGFLVSIAVAMYTSQMPVPFINTDANTRPSALDATEEERNRSWNPNSALSANRSGQPATTTQTQSAVASVALQEQSPPVEPEPPSEVVAIAPDSSAGDPLGDLAARVGGQAAPVVTTPPPASADPYLYFVQAGAFRAQSDAEAQRARLAMNGWDARITSREQQGGTIYRVRVGPFNSGQDAANIKRQFDQQSIDAAVVRQAP